PYYNAVVSSPRPARPVRYIINTSAAPENIGGNAKLAASAQFRRAGTGSFGGATRQLGETATIVAHENVLSAMSTPQDKSGARTESDSPGRELFSWMRANCWPCTSGGARSWSIQRPPRTLMATASSSSAILKSSPPAI